MPGASGKERSAHTIATYARSVRAFCAWLVRRGVLARSPCENVVVPQAASSLPPVLIAEDFDRLLLSCHPPGESGSLAERATIRNRAILWVLFDSGISLSELCALHVGDVDCLHGTLTIRGQGARARCLVLGPQSWHCLRSYLEQHRPTQEELAIWGRVGEDHLFLSESRQALTISGVALLFVRLRRRADITNTQISPQVLRHSFALRYLQAGGNPYGLQALMGYEGMAPVRQYLRWYDQLLHK